MRRFGIFILILCVSAGFIRADERNKPSLQIEDNTFFDPTRKTEPKETYTFGMEYRLEAGYAQYWQRTTKDISYRDMYLHGARVGATFTFQLPLHFGLQTGLLYSIVYGVSEQHLASTYLPTLQQEYIKHRVVEHSLTVPVRAYYTIPLWKELNLFFYTGPQVQIGLAANDYMQAHLSAETKGWLESQNIPTEKYDRIADELLRANVQWGIGGGLEWDRYRLQSGYEFGLNNLIKHRELPKQEMTGWSWFVSFSYRF